MFNIKTITASGIFLILGGILSQSAYSSSTLSNFRFYRAATSPTEFHNITYDNDLKGVNAFQQFANTERNKIDLSQLEARVLDNSKLELKYDSDVKVYFINEGAGYRNQLKLVTTGTSNVSGLIFNDLSCRKDERKIDGRPDMPDIPNKKEIDECQLGSNLAKEKSLRLGDYVHVGELKKGTKLDFQLLQNGYGKTNPTTWYTTTDKNKDKLQHLIAYEYENYLILAWEDLTGGGDKDYNDAVFAVDIGKKNIDEILSENNQVPSAQDDPFSTDADTSFTGGNVLNNNGNGADSDPDGDGLSVSEVIVNGISTTVNNNTQVTLGKGGLLTISKDGSFSYNPNDKFNNLAENANDTETFKYSIDDGNGGKDSAIVTMSVRGVAQNGTPVANNDTFSVRKDKKINDIDVLANDSDPDGDTLVVKTLAGTEVEPGRNSQEISLPSGAWVKIKNNGNIVYNPNGKFDSLNKVNTAEDSFTYSIDDGEGGVSTATVTMTVTAPNGSPNIVDDRFNIPVGVTSTIDVLENDTDPDGDALVIGRVRNVSDNLTVTISDDKKSISVTPEAGFTGTATFEYRGEDPGGEKGWAEVTVKVMNFAD